MPQPNNYEHFLSPMIIMTIMYVCICIICIKMYIHVNANTICDRICEKGHQLQKKKKLEKKPFKLTRLSLNKIEILI